MDGGGIEGGAEVVYVAARGINGVAAGGGGGIVWGAFGKGDAVGGGRAVEELPGINGLTPPANGVAGVDGGTEYCGCGTAAG